MSFPFFQADKLLADTINTDSLSEKKIVHSNVRAGATEKKELNFLRLTLEDELRRNLVLELREEIRIEYLTHHAKATRVTVKVSRREVEFYA